MAKTLYVTDLDGTLLGRDQRVSERSAEIINRLQEKEIYVSAGSACSKGHRSHVLEAMGAPIAAMDGAIRISFGRENTAEDVDALKDALLYAIANL